MERYSIIGNKNKREIVLLKGLPCKWGKCSFCDYILDNSEDEEEIIKINDEVLENITGIYSVLEVINSGSVFELPKETLRKIKKIVEEKKIKKLFFESHWIYRKETKKLREYFQIPIIFKVGVETFDYNFRNDILKKGTYFKSIEEFKGYFDSPCIMVGVKGQTKEQIKKDISIIENNFDHSTVNIYVNNSTQIKRDDDLVKWFQEEFYYLKENPNIEILFCNTDFGVGD